MLGFIEKFKKKPTTTTTKKPQTNNPDQKTQSLLEDIGT